MRWEGPLEKEMATIPVFLPGEFHGQTMASYIIHGVTKSWTQLSDTQKYLKVKKKDCLL